MTVANTMLRINPCPSGTDTPWGGERVGGEKINKAIKANKIMSIGKGREIKLSNG